MEFIFVGSTLQSEFNLLTTMNSVIEFLRGTNFTLWIAVFVSFAIFVLLRRRRPNLPPGPRGLPFLGYLPFLTKEPHLKLHELSKKYGNIFGLYMGTRYVVVVTDIAAARELFNKAEVSDRPPDTFNILPGGIGFGETNGPEWVEQRRYTMQKMKHLGLGNSTWEILVQDEMRNLANILRETGGQPFDICKALAASISNNSMSLVSGQRLPLGDSRRDIVDQGIESFQKVINQIGLISFYPRLYRVALKLGLINFDKELKDMKDLNGYIRNLVHESKNLEDAHTYIQEYLKEIEKNKQLNLKNSFTEENLIGNTQFLVIAGSDTTKVSLLWMFLAMATYPDVQDKIHKELDSVLDKDEDSSGWIDRTRLPYCHAAVLEGQRWRTIAPLNVMHSTNSEITIRNYVIPKNSNVIALLWAFHNDDRSWTQPEVFQPERFLSEDGEVITKMENFAPFSFGKRLCTGENVALIDIFIYFVGIMKRFRVLPLSEKCPPNLKGASGVIFQPPRQQLRFFPR